MGSTFRCRRAIALLAVTLICSGIEVALTAAISTESASAATTSVACDSSILISDMSDAASGDTLSLSPGCTYILTNPNNTTFNPTGLPVVTNILTIDGNGSSIIRSTAYGTPTFQIFAVSVSGNLTVNDLSIGNGGGSPTPYEEDPNEGGAFWNLGTLHISQANITNNSAFGGAGIIAGGSSSTTINESNISSNVSGNGGAAIFGGGTISVSDSTIADNTETSGGGAIFKDGGSMTISSSTIAYNIAPSGQPGGFEENNGGTVSLVASILADSTGGNCGFGQSLTDFGYNLVDDTTCGLNAPTDVIGANPELGALGDNGGPTQTLLPALGSPTVAVIPQKTVADAVQLCPRTDQRGVISVGNCTIGAVEVPFDDYSYAAGGGIGIAPASGNGLDGTTITLASNPFSYPGYTFAGWSDGTNTYAAGATYTLATTGNPVVFTAQWTENPIDTVAFNSDGGTAVSSLSGPDGSSITLPSDTYAGYIFDGWFTASSGGTEVGGAGASFSIPSGGITLFAQWSLGTRTWFVVPTGDAALWSPNYLQSVSCATTTLCVAIGSDTETWDGNSWTTSMPPFQPSYVSCSSGVAFCMATASAGSETWDGTSWSVVGSDPLGQISCTSSVFCMATDANGDYYTWDGATWSPIPSPEIATSQFGCSSDNHCDGGEFLETLGCSVVINQMFGPITVCDDQHVSQSWDGAAWSVSVDGGTFEGPEGGGPGTYSPEGAPVCGGGVCQEVGSSAPEPSIGCYAGFCVTVVSDGNTSDGPKDHIEDSSSSTNLAPYVSSPTSELDGVSCASSTFCVAVGSVGTGSSQSSLIVMSTPLSTQTGSATVVITPSANPSPDGPVTYSVTVSGNGETPSGYVTVSDGDPGFHFCTAKLIAGQGSCTINEQPYYRPYSVTADYSGDSNYLPAASAGLSEAIYGVGGANCVPTSFLGPKVATATAGATFTMGVDTCDPLLPSWIRASGLPPGLVLMGNDDGSATISGTPHLSDGGNYVATVFVAVPRDPEFVLPPTVSTERVTITVDNPGRFTSRTKDLVHTGTAFSYPVTTRYAYPVPAIATVSMLPSGVSLVDNGNGTAVLEGTPDAAAGGIYPITITSANGVGSPVTQSFTLTVYQAPTITSQASDTITAGAAMTAFSVTATGYPIPHLNAVGLPYGVHLVNNLNGTATISGTPRATAAGTYNVSIVATSKAGSTAQAFTLTVIP